MAILDRGRILTRGPLDELVDRHGTGMVELTFDGSAPRLPEGLVEGDMVRVRTERPGADVAGILAGLSSDDAPRLEPVELSRPSLETVFIAITGRAYRSDEDEMAGAGDPATGVDDPASGRDEEAV